MADITKYLETYTTQYLLDLALKEVPDDVAKDQGEIIYDTLAIFCAKMADVFVEVKQIVEQSYMKTATRDETVEYRAAERGITRRQATKARRLGVFTYVNGTPANIQIGSMFSTIDENRANVINYTVVETYSPEGIQTPGHYVLECQTEGTVGNSYVGEILPLTDMDTLGSATLQDVLTPARDQETIESVKERYFATFNIEAFGGNIADYRQAMEAFDGVGQTQIYPRTKVGETIVLSSVDPSNQPISQDYQNELKEELDPENYYNNGNNTSGMGLGIVPIGHKVTVTTPELANLNIELSVILRNTAYFPTVQENIRNNVSAYIKQIQDDWQNGDGDYTSIIYYNQVVTAASTADGVANVDSCLVNGGTQNIEYKHTREKQYMPVLGTLTVSEVK